MLAKFKTASVDADSNVLLGLAHWYNVKTFVKGAFSCPCPPPVSVCVAVASLTVSFSSSNWLAPDNKSVVMLLILYLSLFITRVSANVKFITNLFGNLAVILVSLLAELNIPDI